MLRMARSLHEGPVHHLLQVGVVLLLHIGGNQIADLTGGQGAVLQCTVDGVAAEGTSLDSLHGGDDHGGVIGDLGADDALILAQDVGGLKKVLSNVKMRGTFGEVQLGALLEQMMSPEQYDANVKTKKSGTEFVEFAIKLPGKDDVNSTVYLPIDAKFPKDIYEQYYDAFEAGDTALIESSGKQLENTIKKMAKDIHDKYVDPPFTTDFAIMFLPFESIYAEVIRRTSLVETLQKEYKIVVTGPTTLGAILNSLQMGFRTLAIQKRTGEVWTVLGAVKTEFSKFGGLLEKVQKNLQNAGDQLEEVMGKRTRAIERKLRQVEQLPHEESRKILPIEEDGELFD